MNRVILAGRLTRDPDVRYREGAEPMAVSKFTLAVDRKNKKNEGENAADFISCVAFGKTAEWEEKYLRKGTKVILEGHIQTGSYTNREGQKIFTTDVVVDSQEFAESKKSEGNIETPSASGDGFMNVPDGIDEELPFR